MKTYLKFSIFIVITIFVACNQDIKESIDLQIDFLKVTSYEINKNLKRNTESVEDQKLKEQIEKDIIERYFFIADAYKNKFDTLKQVKKELESMSKFMMVQKYGYLWKKIISPIVDEEKIPTPEKIEKRKKLYYFDYVLSYNHDFLLDILNNDTRINDLDTYNDLKSKNHQYDFLETGYFSMQWPFLTIWEEKEYLFNMEVGQISHLITLDDKYIYLYLDHVEEIEMKEGDRMNLLTELQLGTEKVLEEKKNAEMREKGKPEWFNDNINTVGEFLDNGGRLADYEENPVLLKFELNNEEKAITLKDVVDYMTYNKLIKEYKSTDRLYKGIFEIFRVEYLSNEADKLGLYQEDTFLLDQKNYKNNIILREYLNSKLNYNLETDTLKVKEYYEMNLTDFEQPAETTFDIYLFNTSYDAQQNSQKLNHLIASNNIKASKDTSEIKGLVKVLSGNTFNSENATDYTYEFFDVMMKTKLNSLSVFPLTYEGKPAIIYKTSEKGTAPINFKHAYNLVEEKMLAESITNQKMAILEELKLKYKVEINKTGVNL